MLKRLTRVLVRFSIVLFRLYYQSEIAFFTAQGIKALISGAHLVLLFLLCLFPHGNIELALLTPLYARGALLLTIAHLAVAVTDVVVAQTVHVKV